MTVQLEKLKEAYIKAKTNKEKEQIDAEIQKLIEQDDAAFANGMITLARATADRAEQLVIRKQIEDILPILSISTLVKKYFKKTPQWFYQRLNGNIVNGKPAMFTEQELDTLRFALQDISKQIGSVTIP